jgi:hypothetical protein
MHKQGDHKKRKKKEINQDDQYAYA